MRDAPGTSGKGEHKTNGDIYEHFPEININPKHTKRIYELATGKKVEKNLEESQLESLAQSLRQIHAIIDDPEYEYSEEMQASLRAHFGKFDRELSKQEEAVLEEARKYVVFSYRNSKQRDELINAMKQLGIVDSEPKDNNDGSGNIYISDMHRHSPDEQKDISHNIELIRLTKLFLYAWRRVDRRKELVALKEEQKGTKDTQATAHSHNLGYVKTPPEYEFLQPPISGKDKTKTGPLPSNISTNSGSISAGEVANFEGGDAWSPDLVDDFSQRERDFYDGLDVSKEDYERVIELAPIFSKDLILAKDQYDYVWRVVNGRHVLYRKDSHNKFEEVGVLQQLNMFLQAKEALVTHTDKDKPAHLLRIDASKEQKEALMQVLLMNIGLVVNNVKRRHRHFGGDINNLTQEAWLGFIEALQRADIESTDDESRADSMIMRLKAYIKYYMHNRMRMSNFAERVVITRPIRLSDAKVRYHNIVEAIARKNNGRVDRKLLVNELLKRGIVAPRIRKDVNKDKKVSVIIMPSKKLTDDEINNMSDEVKARLLDQFEHKIKMLDGIVSLNDIDEDNEVELHIPGVQFERTSKAELKKALDAALMTLTPIQERIMRLRFGLIPGQESKTLQEVADEFGVSVNRIEGIEKKVLRLLRHPSRSRNLAPFMDS